MADEIEMYQGNDRTIEVTLTDSDGAAFDLTGVTIYFTVRKSESDAAAVIEKSSLVATEIVIIGVATGGVFEVYLVPADSATIDGEYVYDFTLVTDDVPVETFTVVKDSIKFLIPVK